LRILVVSALVLLARPALAESRVEALAGAGASLRYTTALDLAEVAGQTGYGRGDDTSPAALGFELRAGVLLPVDVELDATGSIAVGGLNLGRVERRYLGSEPQPIGSTLSANADLGARFAPALGSGIRFLIGPSFGAERMAASSPAGGAYLDLFHVGLDAGVRIRTNRISRVVDGSLELVLTTRRELPFALRVARSANDVVLSGTDGNGPDIYSLGIAVEYVFSFHARD
jgi:hypothetical protein